MGLLDLLSDTIGIDPGSQNLRIIKDGKLVYNERAQISFDRTTEIVTGFGNSIQPTSKVIIIQPVNYAIADFHGFEMLLRSAIKKTLDKGRILPKSYKMFFALPTGSTEVEKRAYRDSGEHANGVEVYMIHQSCCSAVGMNLLFEKRHFIIADFSASKTEFIVFANGLIISEGTMRMGTQKIARILKNHFYRKYELETEENEIHDLLCSIGNAKKSDEVEFKHLTIKVAELLELFDGFFKLVNDEFLETIERVSNHPDINKVISNGVYFTGGGSRIDFLREQIKLDERIKRTVSENPMLDCINGLKMVIADKEKFKNYLMA